MASSSATWRGVGGQPLPQRLAGPQAKDEPGMGVPACPPVESSEHVIV
jgi:hypothetical protein